MRAQSQPCGVGPLDLTGHEPLRSGGLSVLSHAEIAWAREALSAGDTLREIAAECGVELLDVARALGLHGYRPPSMRWRQSIRSGDRSPRATPWIGGLFKEVARARYAAGETAKALAAEARIHPEAMRAAVAGARRHRMAARLVQYREAA